MFNLHASHFVLFALSSVLLYNTVHTRSSLCLGLFA